MSVELLAKCYIWQNIPFSQKLKKKKNLAFSPEEKNQKQTRQQQQQKTNKN